MRFMDVELAYFTNLENLPGKKRTPVMLISEINKEVEDLLVLRKNLDHQRDLLHGLSQKVRYLPTLHCNRGRELEITDDICPKTARKRPPIGQ